MTTATAISDRDRTGLAKMVMRLFDLWELSSSDQLAFLGMSTTNRNALSRFRSGHPLSADRDKLERAGLLLGIHKSLRLLFPRNPEMRYGWINRPNRAFKGHTPATVIRDHGLMGLYMVRAYLDRQRGA